VSGLHATITRVDVAGGRPEVVARGVRNSVGFDFQPGTGELWFTDNGRDWFGDDQPPDEVNRVAGPGLHFGFPHCHGASLRDPEYHAGRGCQEFTAPARELGPHVAALGMRFYTGAMFPEKYRGGIFIAEHGSWNRATPIGYRVTFVKVESGRATSYEPFAEGWLKGKVAAGRPADVLVMPDGALLVSDDKAGRIYRIAYEGR
jgi:glucose/arabinose dehydrogenase